MSTKKENIKKKKIELNNNKSLENEIKINSNDL